MASRQLAVVRTQHSKRPSGVARPDPWSRTHSRGKRSVVKLELDLVMLPMPALTQNRNSSKSEGFILREGTQEDSMFLTVNKRGLNLKSYSATVK